MISFNYDNFVTEPPPSLLFMRIEEKRTHDKELNMATKKNVPDETKTPTSLSYNVQNLMPAYINNARIKSTADNVYIDFGFVDPFAPEGNSSSVLQRVVMNRTTFDIFAKHIANQQIENTKNTTDLPIVIMSRCPPKMES